MMAASTRRARSSMRARTGQLRVIPAFVAGVSYNVLAAELGS